MQLEQTAGDGLPVGRWAGQRERRRAEFVDAALAAIAEHGPHTSTEQIAAYVGVTRTKLYRHFDGAADLQRAVAERVREMLTVELAPLWKPQGSLGEVIAAGVGAHVRFMVENRNLYLYLLRSSLGEDTPDAITDTKNAIAAQLAEVFAVYVAAWRVNVDAEPLAFGIVGLVESATSHWLDQPNSTPLGRLVDDLIRWIWVLVDDALRSGGAYVGRDEPLPTPDVIAATAESYRDPNRLDTR